MPQKFNADRRDKIPKQKQRVTNWAEYNVSAVPVPLMFSAWAD
jgi:hypothetical protein